MKRKLELTPTECRTLLHALRIAMEDGSIYGGGDNEAKINRTIEGLRSKLGEKNATVDSRTAK